MDSSGTCPHQSMATVADVDPYGFYDQVRSKAPIAWDDSMNGWLVTSFDLCKEIETREDLYRHPYANATPTMVEIKGGRRNITVLQDPDHAKVHRFFVTLFSPRAVDQFRKEHIEPILSTLLDGFAGKDRLELTTVYTNQIPPRVIMSLSGMPWQDEALVSRVLHLHDVVMEWIGFQNRGDDMTSKARAAAEEINALLRPYLKARKENPGNDMISRMWVDGPRALDNMTDDDALANTREMFLAGTDTTVHALANAMYLLLTKPEIMEAVKADRGEALTNFVEEALRLYGSVQYRFRVANDDCSFSGVSVKKNQVLILVNAAANQDPAHYTAPKEVDLHREFPRDHLAFNVGPRTCVGSALARAEMVDGISMLLDRVINLRLDPAAEQPVFRYHYTRSFRPLHVLFDRVRD